MGCCELAFKEIFKRVEKKYILTREQFEALMPVIDEHMRGDEYGESTICNIYYDTPNHRLIRTSIDKPVYKEKLRIRTYGVPNEDTTTFVEIKKKYKGIVYKRRISMKYKRAMEFTCDKIPPKKDSQIAREIMWFLNFYEGIAPAMVLTYDRTAYFDKDDPNLRVTFDKNITWRDYDLDLTKGVYGNVILPEGTRLMEVKIPDAMPLWLAHKFDELKIYPTSFSKYGRAYTTLLQNKLGRTAGGM